MATDQKINLIDGEATSAPAIENEIPTYRAITGKAIFSFVCGLLAVCSFAHLYFLGFAVAAIFLGVLALRAIKQFPDMYTGKALANAGIALGLIFGLVAFTYDFTTNYARSSAASSFAKSYAEIIKSGTIGDVLLRGMNPDARKSKSAAELERDLEAVQAKPKERMAMEQRVNPIRQLRKRLKASSSEEFHFLDIETHGIEETHGAQLQYFALALFEIEGPGNKEFPEKKQYALAILKGQPSGRSTDWWVEDMKFPYTPKSFEIEPAKPADDGHGHAH